MAAPAAKLSKLRDLSQAVFPEVPPEGYDLVVLGSGPGGETSAVHAAQLGAKVAVVEIKKAFGGPTGLTSKAVREATKQIVQVSRKAISCQTLHCTICSASTCKPSQLRTCS
jgi:glutamate dehydrogenase/leucine dehydrogenase